MTRGLVRAAAGFGVAFVAVLALPGAAFADATVTATTTTPGGRTTITIACGADATSASISGTSFGGPSEIPLEKFTSGGPGAFRGTVTVPASTLPGNYELSATCNTGEGGTGTLVVSPRGAAQGGGGAMSAGPDRLLLAGGGALLVVAGAGAFLVLRRRGRGVPAA